MECVKLIKGLVSKCYLSSKRALKIGLWLLVLLAALFDAQSFSRFFCSATKSSYGCLMASWFDGWFVCSPDFSFGFFLRFFLRRIFPSVGRQCWKMFSLGINKVF